MEVDLAWKPIGTVVGSASTSDFTFILRSFQSRVGDLVAVRMDVPDATYKNRDTIYVWGRVTGIDRYNPFFPQEAAHELSEEGLSLIDTILSNSRDQLQAEVAILGFTLLDEGFRNIYPLTYPVQPAADVYYPPKEAVKELLAGGIPGHAPLKIGTLIARRDVDVAISANRVLSRHMAILAMTGGGKTVAARRILRELMRLRYPIVIFDPHGDYLGIWEKRLLFPDNDVALFYPYLAMTEESRILIELLISKMTVGLTEPQHEKLGQFLTTTDPSPGEPVISYIGRLLNKFDGAIANDLKSHSKKEVPTMRVVRRSLKIVWNRLAHMEKTNEQMRRLLPHLSFEQLPDPQGRPEGIVCPGRVSILYLGGYDRLTQTTIVSIVMESLFEHRANLSNRIPPFQTFIEEAHTFIPSTKEGTSEAPSLETIRKVITEGRKFGTGLVLISQRPSRVDETILSQCNSFLILRLVNPRDQNYVKAIMENLSDTDARMLPGFGPGQGIISGQAVRFPLLVKIAMDDDLMHSGIGDEDFIAQAEHWKPSEGAEDRQRAAQIAQRLVEVPSRGTSEPHTERVPEKKQEKTGEPPLSEGDEVLVVHDGRLTAAVVHEVEEHGATWLNIESLERLINTQEIDVFYCVLNNSNRDYMFRMVQAVEDWYNSWRGETVYDAGDIADRLCEKIKSHLNRDSDKNAISKIVRRNRKSYGAMRREMFLYLESSSYPTGR